MTKPHLTEKSLDLARGGWYSFVVGKSSRKENIARDIGKLYGVTVTKVRTVAMHGKVRHTGKRRTIARKPDWKKALVRLAKGQKIEAFEVPTEEKK